ncbi:hypothetical protein [Williamsia sp. 1135]|uniref:hypothetical protein n=1 Tax=Williamsia sp. 1135 TaxID=1889262 RepID=UPI001F0B4481|nr:hypothetical protein [Williamsia sp. 1135]
MNLRGLFEHLSTLAADPLLLAPLDDLALSEETVYALRAKNVLDVLKGLNHIDRRDPDLSESDRDDCVRGLLTEARVSTPAAVSRRVHEMAIALSPPDKEVPDAENDDLNEVSFGTGDDGRTHGTLDLDKTLGEKLATALRPLSKLVPEPDGSPDPAVHRNVCPKPSARSWMCSSPTRNGPPKVE